MIKLKQPGERLTWEDCKAMSFTQDVGHMLRNTKFRKVHSLALQMLMHHDDHDDQNELCLQARKCSRL